jgi:hypothetical protein
MSPVSPVAADRHCKQGVASRGALPGFKLQLVDGFTASLLLVVCAAIGFFVTGQLHHVFCVSV